MYRTGDYPISVKAGDFNRDTKLDIVVANEEDNSVSVLLGNGDGTFQNQTTYLTGTAPQFVVVDDFNNNTKRDIIVANDLDNSITVLLC
jgi:hypothetical protein